MRELLGIPLELDKAGRQEAITAFSEGILGCLEYDLDTVETSLGGTGDSIIHVLNLVTSDFYQAIEIHRVTATEGDVLQEQVSLSDHTDRGSAQHYMAIQPAFPGYDGSVTRYDINDRTSLYQGYIADMKQILRGEWTSRTTQADIEVLPPLSKDRVDADEIRSLFDFIQTARQTGILHPISTTNMYRRLGLL